MAAPWRVRKPGGRVANYYGFANSITRDLKYEIIPRVVAKCKFIKRNLPGIFNSFAEELKRFNKYYELQTGDKV